MFELPANEPNAVPCEEDAEGVCSSIGGAEPNCDADLAEPKCALALLEVEPKEKEGVDCGPKARLPKAELVGWEVEDGADWDGIDAVLALKAGVDVSDLLKTVERFVNGLGRGFPAVMVGCNGPDCDDGPEDITGREENEVAGRTPAPRPLPAELPPLTEPLPNELSETGRGRVPLVGRALSDCC